MVNIGKSWRELPDMEDKLLYHIAEKTGLKPASVSDAVPSVELAECLAEELGIRPDEARSTDYFHSDARKQIRTAMFSLKEQGLVKTLPTIGNEGAWPTRAGKDRVRNWQTNWSRRRDDEIQRRILEELDQQRRDSPQGHELVQLNVPALCADMEIVHKEYLANAKRLLDQQKIQEPRIEQLSVETGYAYITEAGIRALENGSTAPPRRSEQEAWVEVARLRQELAIAKRDLPSLIKDKDLHRRCHQLLTAEADYDRAIREACVVLEDRVRNALGEAGTGLIGEQLIGKAFSGKSPLLRLSDHSGEQQGAMFLFKGVMQFFRNAAGHKLIEDFSQDEALRLVAFVDLLLELIDKATQHKKTKESIRHA